jgi:hypothetical protein
MLSCLTRRAARDALRRLAPRAAALHDHAHGREPPAGAAPDAAGAADAESTHFGARAAPLRQAAGSC